MYQIDVMSRVPVYEQIVNQTEKFVLTGVLNGGDKMPSVRALSMQLSINPNTIQKAMNELDHRGITLSVPGKGCFVTEGAKETIMKNKRLDLNEVETDIRELKLVGVTKQEIYNIVDKIYEEVENND